MAVSGRRSFAGTRTALPLIAVAIVKHLGQGLAVRRQPPNAGVLPDVALLIHRHDGFQLPVVQPDGRDQLAFALIKPRLAIRDDQAVVIISGAASDRVLRPLTMKSLREGIKALPRLRRNSLGRGGG